MNTLSHVTSANDVTVTLATPHSLTVQEAQQKKTEEKKTSSFKHVA